MANDEEGENLAAGHQCRVRPICAGTNPRQFDHKDRARGIAQDLFGDASHEKSFSSGPPVCTHDDAVNSGVAGIANDFRGWVAFQKHVSDGNVGISWSNLFEEVAPIAHVRFLTRYIDVHEG
jgi:hypothetical protein